MQNLRSTLPPMGPLIAFEAAARHENFTRAAEELNLSQAAVSQQIRNLERALGTALFLRTHRKVRLSPEGRRFQHTIAAALRQIAVAAAELRARPARASLTVAADQSIAALWLLPRLPRFHARHGDIAVRLVASDEERDSLAAGVDIAIIHGAGAWPGFASTLFFGESIFPVCSQDYLARRGPIGAAAELPSHALLEFEDARWDWMNWRNWLSNTGVDLPAQTGTFRINSYPLLIEAAKNGQGVALGWDRLVDDAIASGALVRPVAESVETDAGYHFVWSEARALPDAASAFRDWAAAELSAAPQP
ncbi:LysR substrate-binding domain-containing protein [Pikeienuella piscinae]|nr:LysR substrate-binding domain-containing protein [Pikeienuella piscinae]